MNELILYRNFLESDRNFILKSWIKTAIIKDNVNPSLYRKYIIYNLKNSHIIVASLRDDPMFILGFVVFNNDGFLFCYIKKTFRELGVLYGLYREVKRRFKGKKLKCIYQGEVTKFKKQQNHS